MNPRTKFALKRVMALPAMFGYLALALFLADYCNSPLPIVLFVGVPVIIFATFGTYQIALNEYDLNHKKDDDQC